MEAMELETVKAETVDKITTVTFNRPEARNAMSPQFHVDMRELMKKINLDQDTRVVVLTGAGVAWIAGMDLKKFFYEGWKDPVYMAEAGEAARAWMGALRLSPKPTIAMVNGYVFGAAWGVLSACDIAVADEEALLGLPEINWGIAPGGNLLKDIPEMMGFRDLMFYALTGRNMTGKEASEKRFVTMAVPKDELRMTVWEIAEDLAQKDPVALTATKIGAKMSINMDHQQQFTFMQAMTSQARRQAEARGTGGPERAIEQFMDKKYRPAFGNYDWESEEANPR